MPELPEVETIIKVIKPILVGQKIKSVDILKTSIVKSDLSSFASSLSGKTFHNITRKGKFLVFHLSDDTILLTHLRMEGKFYEVDEKDKNSYFSRIVFHLNNNKKLCYDDSRCFGIMIVSTESEYMKVKEIKELGPEPFDIIDSSLLYESNKNNTRPIKVTITDQKIIAGIGNIYADEILFACKIHPLTKTKLLNKKDWENIIYHAKRILNNAIESGGSTIKSYHPGKNIDGNFQVNLKVYGKNGQLCPNCSHPLRYIKVNTRGTTFCPVCQQKIGNPINVAIFGPAGSGKSTVSQLFSNKGYDIISSDKVVHDLYKTNKVISMINKLFSFNFQKEIDFKLLRTYLVNNPKKIKVLENYIHPLVEIEIDKFLKNSKSKIRVCEVPLLYQAHYENKFDYIIGVFIDKDIQLERLKSRNISSAKQLNAINKTKEFDKFIPQADYIIYNNSTLDNLTLETKKIINILEDRLK